MEKKLRKQRKNIIIKITAVLFAVWLIVSVVFCTITLTAEKQEQITKSHNDYTYLADSISSFSGMSYNEMCKYVQIAKEHYVDIVKGDIKEEEINCGAETGNYDTDMQITLYRSAFFGESEEDLQDELIMNTDEETYLAFRADDYSERFGDSGILNYDEFVSTLSQNQLDTIKEYLNKKKDSDGFFYLLRCHEIYYNPENGHVYPKTVEIVKAYEDSFGYGVKEVVDTYDLTPKTTDSFILYETNKNEPCIIDGEFICNNFSSGGLIENPFEKLSLEFYDPDTGIVEKNGLFTFTFNESGHYLVETLGFDESDYAISYRTAVDESLEQTVEVGHDENGTIYDAPDPTVQYLSFNIGLRYAKQINLIECCGSTLIIGISALFLFFLIIGIILAVMMCKVMKTQMTEEQKRVEVTNALAHDIKTPLFIISGYAQNLKENVNTDKREHYCDRIIERTDEVNELVHKMLDFSNPEVSVQSLDFSSFMLKDITNEVLNNFDELKNSRNIILSTNDTHEIYADKEQIERVIRNLLDNALRYSDEDTDITIDINEKSFSISNVCSNISSEDVKHLTEPYYRVEKNRNTKGNGLGLSIVKSILDVHGYKLDIKLQNNLITFTIEF